MRLINKGRSTKYSGLAKTTIKPGCSSRELDTFEKTISGFESSVRGFDVVLSEKDADILYSMCVKYLLPSFKNIDCSKDEALAELRSTMEDPNGTKVFRDVYRARRAAIQAARAKVINEVREKEARVRSESNIIGVDGNPIASKMSEDKSVSNVKPELHPEMSTDLRSIIANNLAVMTTASGKPISSQRDVVAKPGGSPVSHNPKDYQKPRSVAPGQPEYFK